MTGDKELTAQQISPGPWEWVDCGYYHDLVAGHVEPAQWRRYHVVTSVRQDELPRRADRELIAAAPELLRVARDFILVDTTWMQLAGERARALIARIEGK